MFEKPISRQDWIIIISVATAVYILLHILITFACVVCCRRMSTKKALNTKKPTPEKEISPNQIFYESLPFKGFNRPPSQVINRDSCVYADCDYADYADGPLSYNSTSKLQVIHKKTENGEKEP
eukprot:GFUD01049015.1.p1 GENE.GFUD01049015.1~~GFUD01049015.1.p1  ORF type:complete len:123 (-),score=31.51 GFUD01049015.1:25-393(-)